MRFAHILHLEKIYIKVRGLTRVASDFIIYTRIYPYFHYNELMNNKQISTIYK